MKKYTWFTIAAALTLSAVLSHTLHAAAPLDCSVDDCASVHIPYNSEPMGTQLPVSEDMPPAEDTGNDSGDDQVDSGEAPETKVVDPVAPNEPPSP